MSSLELVLTLPPGVRVTVAYSFQKILLRWNEYPPDANHGVYLPAASVTFQFSKENLERLKSVISAQEWELTLPIWASTHAQYLWVHLINFESVQPLYCKQLFRQWFRPYFHVASCSYPPSFQSDGASQNGSGVFHGINYVFVSTYETWHCYGQTGARVGPSITFVRTCIIVVPCIHLAVYFSGCSERFEWLASYPIYHRSANQSTTMAGNGLVRIYSETSLIRLPVPDFSMPFNALCLVCSVVAILFGSVHKTTTNAVQSVVARPGDGDFVDRPPAVRLARRVKAWLGSVAARFTTRKPHEHTQ